jgi:hypothetical protein
MLIEDRMKIKTCFFLGAILCIFNTNVFCEETPTPSNSLPSLIQDLIVLTATPTPTVTVEPQKNEAVTISTEEITEKSESVSVEKGSDNTGDESTPIPIKKKKVKSGEGYKGIPWGTSYENSGLKNTGVSSMEPPGDLSYKFYDLGIILGDPNSLNGYESHPSDRMTPQFDYYSDDQNGIIYIFLNNNFIMAYVSLDSNNYDVYKAKIENKYKFNSVFHKDWPKNSNSMALKLDVSFYENATTEVDLIKELQTDYYNGFSNTYTNVIYGSKTEMNNIRKGILQKILKSKQNENYERQKSKEEDLQKIQ